MTVLKGRRLAGKAWLVTPGIAQTNATAFTVSLSASSGLSGTPVTVTVAPVGGLWAPSTIVSFTVVGLTGTFSQPNATAVTGTTAVVTATFTPSSAAPAAGSISATSPGLTNQSGGQGYNVVAATATGYSMTQPNGAGFVGQVNPITLAPTPNNSVWPSGTITLAASGVAGAFSPSATVTPTLNSSAPVSLNWTPSAAGTATISATNTNGLTNPTSLTYNVSVASGSNATLTVTPLFDDHRIFNRDVRSGNPVGFSTTYGKGWSSKVKITLSATIATTGGLWMRLHDGLDPNATSSGPNTGAVLQPAIQVPGVTSIQTTPTNVSLTVPAAKAWYYADLALNASMTNAVRIPIKFGVGSNIFAVGTSHMGAFMTAFQYQGYETNPALVAPTPTIAHQSPFTAFYIAPSDDATVVPWLAPDNLGTNYFSPGAAELTGRMADTLGVNCGIVSNPGFGGSLMDDSVLDTAGHHWWGVTQRALRHTDYSFDAFIAIWAANDYGFNHSRDWMKQKVDRVFAAIDPAFAGITPYVGVMNCTPQWAGHDSTTGFRTGARTLRDVVASHPGWANHLWMDSGGAGSDVYARHESPLDKVREGRQWYRYIAGAMGAIPLRQGPYITNASRNGAVITLTVAHDGGTALRPAEWSENAPPNNIMQEDATATSVALGNLFAVYHAGETFNYITGGKVAVDATAPVTIVNATTIQLKLAADPGATAALDVYYGWDMEGVGGWPNSVPCITDDVTDVAVDGLTWGRPMRRTLDPIYVPPVTLAAQTLTLNTPLDTVAGAWIMLSGGGAGPPLAGSGLDTPVTSIEVQVAGGAWTAPTYCVVRNNMQWSGYLKAPASPAAGVALAVRRAGQSAADATTTFNVVSARNSYPASFKADVVAAYNATNIGTLWQDSARTIPATEMSPVSAWDDQLGTSSNVFKQTLYPGVDTHAPLYDMRVASMNDRNNLALDRPALTFDNASAQLLIARGSALATALAGSFTIIITTRAFGAQIVAGGNTNPAWNPPYSGTGNIAQTGGLALSDSFAGRFPKTGSGGSTNYNPAHGIIETCMVMRYDNTTGVTTIWSDTGSYARWSTKVSSTAATDLSTITMDTLYIGATMQVFNPVYSSDLRLHELIFVGRTLTDAEINTDVQAYIDARWPW